MYVTQVEANWSASWLATLPYSLITNLMVSNFFALERIRPYLRGDDIDCLILQCECRWIYNLKMCQKLGLTDKFVFTPFLHS